MNTTEHASPPSCALCSEETYLCNLAPAVSVKIYWRFFHVPAVTATAPQLSELCDLFSVAEDKLSATALMRPLSLGGPSKSRGSAHFNP